MHVWREMPGKVLQVEIHDPRIGIGHEPAVRLACVRANRAEEIDPFVVCLLYGTRAATGFGPNSTDCALLTDTGFILKPEFDDLVGMQGAGLPQRLGEDVFLKSSCLAGSAFGC